MQYIVDNIEEEQIGESCLLGNFFPKAELEDGGASSDLESGRNQELVQEPISYFSLHRVGPAGRSMKRRRILD